jgi:hypothetical protein
VPSALRLVQAALSATLTSSANLRDRIPLVHGLVDILAQARVEFVDFLARVRKLAHHQWLHAARRAPTVHGNATSNLSCLPV